MLVLLHMELGQQEDAEKAADLLLQLVARSTPHDIADMWPETLVVHRAVLHLGSNTVVEGLLAHLFEQRSQRENPHGLLAWHNQIASNG
ncbi:MAG: hypothetical protein H7Z17_15270 [Fuerstia sp.]|nr:hypothetical protein [Fuerstiella sp.]